MTKEEATQILRTRIVPTMNWQEIHEAIDMAIEALKAEPNKAVPLSLADVYKWERDIALSQLEEYGICFGEKKRDDLVEVVRCGECRHMMADGRCYMFADDNIKPSASDFCSYGERKQPYKGGDEE